MPKLNENAFVRYKAINNALRENTTKLLDSKSQVVDLSKDVGEALSIAQLVDACNAAYEQHGIEKQVKRSWVYEDIKFLREKSSLNAPIETRTVNRMADYYYSDPTFSIFNTEWYKQQVLSFLENALNILDTDLIPGSDSLEKLRTQILDELSEVGGQSQIIYLSSYPHAKFHRFFYEVYRAIRNQSALELEYEPFEEDPIKTIFHPQIIKEYNRRYFVFGLNDGQLRNYPLDRIKNVAMSSAAYIHDDRDWHDHFYNLVGVTRYDEAELTEVVLRLFGKDANYFYTKPETIGKVTRVDKASSYSDFKMTVYLNRELENMILTYLPNIEILEPMRLKESIAKRIEDYISSSK